MPLDGAPSFKDYSYKRGPYGIGSRWLVYLHGDCLGLIGFKTKAHAQAWVRGLLCP